MQECRNVIREFIAGALIFLFSDFFFFLDSFFFFFWTLFFEAKVEMKKNEKKQKRNERQSEIQELVWRLKSASESKKRFGHKGLARMPPML